MDIEMDPIAFLSHDIWLSRWSLLWFRADSCTRGEGRGEEGCRAFPCCPAVLAGRAGAGRNAAVSWRRSMSGSFWLRGSDWKAGSHRAAHLPQSCLPSCAFPAQISPCPPCKVASTASLMRNPSLVNGFSEKQCGCME